MEAAKHGHSTLGIPQKVGDEFATADEQKKQRREQIAAQMKR